MNSQAKKAATYEDLQSLPETVVGEILAGELFATPRPTPRHSLAATMISAELVRGFGSRGNKGDGDWWIINEPECHLGKDIVVPDIAGWRKSTMPEIPVGSQFEIPPDWVCEVISPSTARNDRGIKRIIYAREKVMYYWIVDPMERIVEVFNLVNGVWQLKIAAIDDQSMPLPPFETMPFDLTTLWI